MLIHFQPVKVCSAPVFSNSLRKTDRTGSALVLVLVVIAMLSLGAYTFSQLMITEYRATRGAGIQLATRNWAESGVEYMAALLTPDAGGWDMDLYHAPEVLHQRVTDGGGFTIVAPLEYEVEGTPFRIGVQDESARINLNAIAQLDPSSGIARTLLIGLPNMTEEIADCILDWIDADSTTRDYGAEAESNALIPPPNAPLQTLDELLLIPGVTVELLYGEDANRNGILDPNENDGENSYPFDNADGSLDLGWAEYFTLVSKESNLQRNSDYFGEPRLNVNELLLTDLYDQLEDQFGTTEAQFITAYRLNGPLNTSGSDTGSGQGADSSGTSAAAGSRSSSGSGGLSQRNASSSGNISTGNALTDQQLLGIASNLASALGGNSGAVTRGGMDVSAGGSTRINSIYELIGVQVSATIDGQTTVLDSPWKADPGSLQQSLPELLDRLSTTADPEIQGRININQARREVLLGIPGIPEGVADAIISIRSQRISGAGGAAGRFATAGWLLIEGLVDLETMRELDSSITGGGSVLRVQVIGHSDQIGPISRVEAVIDGTQTVPRTLSMRNLSDLGPGFRREQLPVFGGEVARQTGSSPSVPP